MKTIRVGVVGVNRGQAFARDVASLRTLKLVAICDTWEERLAIAGRKLGVTTYPDFDEFLGHDMDAVILANYFHEHAPLAIRALEAGMHVMSETRRLHHDGAGRRPGGGGGAKTGGLFFCTKESEQ